jgi:vitamin B12 transporter
MSVRTPIALVLALNAPLLVLAQAAPVSSSSSSSSTASTDYVVTASRTPETTGSTVRPVQVITAEDIRLSGAGSLTDLLATLGGVEITRNGGLGQSSSVFLRGANSDHTVVLIDGVRVGSATLGTASFEAIPLAQIERVEVLAGPSSSLYGSAAIGGVIQIFTKSAQRSPGVNVAATAGSNGLRQLAGSYAARHGDTDVSFGAQVLRTDGFNVTTPDNTYNYNPDRDGFINRSLNARVNQQLGGGHELGVQWLRSDGTTHFDDGIDVADTHADNRTQTLATYWQGPLMPGVQSELRLARAWDQSMAYSSYPGFINTVQDQASWLNHISLAGGTLSAGAEWLKQKVDSDTAYSVTSRSVRSGLLGWHAHYGALSVQADARHDRNSQFGNHSTAQLALAYQLDPSLRLRGSVGNAFTAPSFNLLYYPGFGNANLKPERSTSYELGGDWQVAGLSLGATLFDNRLRDLIDYAPPTYEPANVAQADNQGLTLTAAGALGEKTRAKLNLTVQNPQNSDTGYQLRRRARQFGGLHLTHQLGQVTVGTDLTVVGYRFDSVDESAGSRMGGYGLVALFASWRVTPDWSLEGRVNNAANKHYVSVPGYVTAGREGQLTLRWTPAL